MLESPARQAMGDFVGTQVSSTARHASSSSRTWNHMGLSGPKHQDPRTSVPTDCGVNWGVVFTNSHRFVDALSANSLITSIEGARCGGGCEVMNGRYAAPYPIMGPHKVCARTKGVTPGASCRDFAKPEAAIIVTVQLGSAPRNGCVSSHSRAYRRTPMYQPYSFAIALI